MPSERKYKTRSEVDADFDKHPVIEGIITEIRKLPEKAGGRRAMVIDTGDAIYRVYESFTLEDAFKQGKKGDHIRVEFMERKELKDNKSLNVYNVAVWTE